jgi:hypothetical protein
MVTGFGTLLFGRVEKESFTAGRTFPGLGKIHNRPVLHATETDMVGCTTHLALTASPQNISRAILRGAEERAAFGTWCGECVAPVAK